MLEQHDELGQHGVLEQRGVLEQHGVLGQRGELLVHDAQPLHFVGAPSPMKLGVPFRACDGDREDLHANLHDNEEHHALNHGQSPHASPLQFHGLGSYKKEGSQHRDVQLHAWSGVQYRRTTRRIRVRYPSLILDHGGTQRHVYTDDDLRD